MSGDIPSIRDVSPGYVLAAGTQVVLKVSKVVASVREETARVRPIARPGLWES